MASSVERIYGKVFKSTLKAVNPLKKTVIVAECKVHKFINAAAVEILKNDGYNRAWQFFASHLVDLNSGTVWADQDLKSSNHFYNPYTKKGLYGSGNALKECISYYTAALTFWNRQDIRKSLFYLGAACHLVQDMTVPQHANVNLLKHHRKFEKWVIKSHSMYESFKCTHNGIYLNGVKDFIEENAYMAIKIYNRSKSIVNLESRFYNITDAILCRAQRTTAGMLNMFYETVCSMAENQRECAG